MYIFEIAGIVVTVVFIVYFLVVRETVLINNKLIDEMNRKMDVLNASMSSIVEKLFNEKIIICNWKDGNATEDHQKTQLQLSVEEILKPLANDAVNGERFIDEVVKRINKKQVG